MMRVVLVDDEPMAREGLRLWLACESDVSIIGEAGTPAEAVALILREQPDLVFLDVQMPEADGFAVLEAVASQHLPEVVFVTAHERHALRAFEVSALDFLLKPVREERFRAALVRARGELARGDAREGPGRLSALLDRVRGSGGPDGERRIERFAVRTRDRYVLVPAADVHWIAAAGNYAELHTSDGATHLVRSTLTELEAGLDPVRFARIHRGTLVRLDQVREVVPATHGDYDLVLLDGTILKLSRRFRDRVLGS
ncbi:MAG: LytTR family DNA-binding domain-containing protein [Candidatus Eisenbacteria bacterium]